MLKNILRCSKAFPVDDGGTRFVILVLTDPHLLEGAEGGKDGTTNPHTVLPLRGGNDLDLHSGGSQLREFLSHPLTNALEHGGATRQNNILVKILPDINVTLHDGLKSGIVNAASFLTNEMGLEENFGAPKPLVTNGDDVTIGKFIGFLVLARLSRLLHLLIKVKLAVGKLFLDIPDDFPFLGGGERITPFGQDLHQILSQIPTLQIQPENLVGKLVTFINGHSVRNTVTAIHNNTGGPTGLVKRQDLLDLNIHLRNIESLEHDLSHSLSVLFRVKGLFSEQDGMLFGLDPQLVVESVVPDFLHIIPVSDNTVLDGVFQGKNTSLGLSFITDIGVFLVHTNHDTGHFRSTHNRGENSPRSIITLETGFAHTGTVVDDELGNFFFLHFERYLSFSLY